MILDYCIEDDRKVNDCKKDGKQFQPFKDGMHDYLWKSLRKRLLGSLNIGSSGSGFGKVVSPSGRSCFNSSQYLLIFAPPDVFTHSHLRLCVA